MKNAVCILLILILLVSITACSNEKGQDYLNAKVMEIKEDVLIVECIDESTNQLAGSILSVSTNVVSADGIPQMEIGQEIRVVFDFSKVDKQDDPVRIEHVYAIYLLDDNGVVISNTNTEDGVANNTDVTEQGISTIYSFYGENEFFTISNVTLSLSDSGQKFNAGELTITKPSLFESVTSYSTCFYTTINGERDVFHSTNTTGLADDDAPNGRKLGTASSNGFMIRNLEQGLWFELKTMDLNGTENAYQIQLTLAE